MKSGRWVRGTDRGGQQTSIAPTSFLDLKRNLQTPASYATSLVNHQAKVILSCEKENPGSHCDWYRNSACYHVFPGERLGGGQPGCQRRTHQRQHNKRRPTNAFEIGDLWKYTTPSLVGRRMKIVEAPAIYSNLEWSLAPSQYLLFPRNLQKRFLIKIPPAL